MFMLGSKKNEGGPIYPEKAFPSKEAINELLKFNKENFGDETIISIDTDDEVIAIRVDTDDNTSKENYDDLLGLGYENLEHVTLHELWADHNTQIIEFKEK